MKYLQTFSWVLLSTFILLMTACKEETYEIGEPFSKLEGINGKWVISQVKQFDYTKRPVFDIQVDVSSLMIADNPFSVTFNASNLTYEVASSGVSTLLGTGGTWEFNNVDYPTAIYFRRNDGSSTTVQLKQTVRIVDSELVFEIPKECTTVASPEFGYLYVFNRVVN